MAKINVIERRSGTAFILNKGERLKVIDPEGEQVADLICYNRKDPKEYLSSGRSLDYAETIFLTQGHTLYSNRSQPMLQITEDTAGRHDFLLTPCSQDTFRKMYGHTEPHRGCHGNLEAALSEFGIDGDAIPTTFNTFMTVDIDSHGRISVLPPRTKAGDYTIFTAEMDLIVGLTACSAEQSNNFAFKPIHYSIIPKS